MESPHHTLNDLFAQLGLPNNDPDIDAFISLHKSIPAKTKIQSADFFTASQKDFLQQAFNDDADWVVVIEHLDAMLRRKAESRES